MGRRKKKEPKPEINLLDLVPERRLPHEVAEENLVVVFAPRFRGRLTRRWLEPLLRRPPVRVKFDEVGSAIWLACDGRTAVREIAQGLQARFGEKVEPLHDRLALFLRQLEGAGFLRFANMEELLRTALPGGPRGDRL